MIQSISVKNFKSLKDFKLSSLKQINLLTGKNNTGKTTILSAFALLNYKGNFRYICQMLLDSGEDITKNILGDTKTSSIAALFTDREIGFKDSDALFLESQTEQSTDRTSISLVRLGLEKSQLGQIIKRPLAIDESYDDFKSEIGIEIKHNGKSTFKDKDSIDFSSLTPRTFDASGISQLFNLYSLEPQDTSSVFNPILWDRIDLTDKEEYVIKALQLIEPGISGIKFVDNGAHDRKPMIKLSKNQFIVPLQCMGDGINRILTIILAMVNSENGLFIIDEIENGLHYSVQEKLWAIIFDLAQKLNIQVFATTHSRDCIDAFAVALTTTGNEDKGTMIRLDKNNEHISKVYFDAEELAAATNQNIEIR
ncbi:MAG: AAA family ATPase [Bacteroidota bacterium]